MADQRVNGNLILIGSSGGTIALGCQPSGGGFTILLPTNIPQIGQSLVITSVYNGNTATAQWGLPSTPAVTSVGFTAPSSVFTVSGQPITNNGVIALGLAVQNANTVFAGPLSGSAVPTFRSLVIADLPATGTADDTTFLRGDGIWTYVPIVSTYVETFNGRSGVVVAAGGDYSYSQISGTPQLPVQPIVPTSNWLDGYNSTSGVFSFSQPASTDLSDSAALARLASPTFTGTVTLPAVSVTGSMTFTTANPTFFSVTGSGQVVLATSPTITSTTLAGTTSITNAHIMGTLADNTNSTGTSGQVLTAGTGSQVVWGTPTIAFNNIASGTNATATMTVGSGALLTFSGTGVVNANEIYGVVINNTAPVLGQVLTATSATTAQWSTPSSSGAVNSGTAGQLTWYAATGSTVSGNADATISSGTLTLGVAGTTAGNLVLSSTSAGSYVTIAAQTSSFTPWTLTLPLDFGTAGYVLATDGSGITSWVMRGTGTGDGSVTFFSSADLSPLFTTSVVNPASTPALSFTATSQSQNLFYASPDGSSGVPSFRALTDDDLPGGVTGTGAVVLANAPTFTANPTFASSTGTGAVVLAAGPSLTGTTGIVDVAISGALTDNASSTGTSGQVLTAGTGGQVMWGSGGGTIGGTIAANQIGFGSALNTLASSSDFTWTSGVFDASTVSTAIAAMQSGENPVLQQFSFLNSSVSSYDFSYPSPVTAGNQLVVFVGLDQTATTPTSFTDNQGNTWTQQEFFVGGGDTHGFSLWTATAGTSGTLTISLTFSIATDVAVLCAEIQNTSGIEQILLNGGSSTFWPSSTLTTLVSNELLLAFDVAYRPPASPTDSFTELQSQTLTYSGNVQMDMAAQLAPTVGPYTSSWRQASSGEWHTIIMSYPVTAFYPSGGDITLTTTTLYPTGGNITLTAAATITATSSNTITLTNTGVNGTVVTDTGGGGITLQTDPTNGGVLNIDNAGRFVFYNNSGSTGSPVQLIDSSTAGMGVGLYSQNGSASLFANSASSPSMSLLNDGAGGTTIEDDGGGGILIQAAGGVNANFISLNNTGSGGTTITDSGGGGILVQNTNTDIDIDASGVSSVLELNPSGQPTQISGHLNTNVGGGSNTTDFANVATISNPASTVAVNFHSAFTGTNAPLVVLTPTTDPTATGGYWVTYSGGTGAWTGFVVNVTTMPTSSISFNYIVIGNQS